MARLIDVLFLDPTKRLVVATPQANIQDVDFTVIPSQLETRFEALNGFGAVRPTPISVGDVWTKYSKDAQGGMKLSKYDIEQSPIRGQNLALLHGQIPPGHCSQPTVVPPILSQLEF